MKKAVLSLCMMLAAYSLSAQSMTPKDAQFAYDAFQAGMLEIKLGEMTITKAKSDSVRVLGRQMIIDHTKANDELKTLAVAKNITLSDSLSEEGKKHYNDLVKLTGCDFDKAYVNLMVADHKKAVDQFKNESETGSDTQIKAFASLTLPVIKHHLMTSQDLSVDLERNKTKTSTGPDKLSTLK